MILLNHLKLKFDQKVKMAPKIGSNKPQLHKTMKHTLLCHLPMLTECLRTNLKEIMLCKLPLVYLGH